MRKLHEEIKEIKELLTDAYPPEHFSAKDVMTALLAAIIVGSSFFFNTLLVSTSIQLTFNHVVVLVLVTALVLTAEIYFVGYERVPNKSRRRFGQFWAKRFFTFYGISLAVAFSLAYLYGFTASLASSEEVLRVIIAVSFPCTVAIGLADLVK